jgi:hypothetical protein
MQYAMTEFRGENVRKLLMTDSPVGPGPRERWKYEQKKRAVMAADDPDALGGAELQEAPPERALIASVVGDLLELVKNLVTNLQRCHCRILRHEVGIKPSITIRRVASLGSVVGRNCEALVNMHDSEIASVCWGLFHIRLGMWCDHADVYRRSWMLFTHYFCFYPHQFPFDDLGSEEQKVAARAKVRVQIQDNAEVLALFVATSSMADCRQALSTATKAIGEVTGQLFAGQQARLYACSSDKAAMAAFAGQEEQWHKGPFLLAWYYQGCFCQYDC